ncbi:MAG: hypothetical protein KatS3mg068_1622 [Candidatus Sericytochromatia bacterium]|nr:MAG: hypothetical protein KatS3mg068_1622 [Candidatus Sericytochromatia bacterium]
MRKEFLGIHNYYLYKDSGLLFNNINISKNINLSGLRFSSSEDQMTIRLRGNMSFEEKLEQIRAITGNDPRVVLDRQTLDALASGKDVAIHIEKNTERRNLLIGLGSLAAMLIGGIAGASYNKELANAVDDRIKGDVDFIKRNPHWDMNPFGGATATRYNITATTIDEPNNPSRTEPSKNFDQLIIENINRIQREMAVKLGIRADINPFERAKNYGGRFNERSHLNTSVYTLSQEDMQDPAVVAYLKSKGRTLKVGSQLSVEDAFQINMIKTFGLNVLQSMSTGLKDGDGYVAGFSDELLRMNDKDLLERINAIRSFKRIR